MRICLATRVYCILQKIMKIKIYTSEMNSMRSNRTIYIHRVHVYICRCMNLKELHWQSCLPMELFQVCIDWFVAFRNFLSTRGIHSPEFYSKNEGRVLKCRRSFSCGLPLEGEKLKPYQEDDQIFKYCTLLTIAHSLSCHWWAKS